MTEPLSPPSYPIDHLARRGAANAPALLIGDRITSFAELDAGVGRLASWLLEQAGGPTVPPRLDRGRRRACGSTSSCARQPVARAGLWCARGEPRRPPACRRIPYRSEEHTSELQSLMRNSYAVFCLKKK